MSTWRTGDEVRAGYCLAMGEELGTLFHALTTELTWTSWHWQEYRHLFGTRPERIDLLNAASPFFFHVVQSVLLDDALLGIARLIGPAKSAGKPSLTIRRLTTLVAEEHAAETRALVDRAVQDGAFAVDWRHRRIAHRDLDLALKAAAVEPLAPTSRQSVENALEAIAAALNHVELAYCRSTTVYRNAPTTGGAEQLLYVIRDGLARERERHERIQRGEYTMADVRGDE